MAQERGLGLKNICMIILGAAIYAFAFVYFYLDNEIAANGLAGLAQVGYALFRINPTISGYVINLPILLFGAYLFGRRAVSYSIIGVLSLYLFVWIFQKVPLQLDLQNDSLVVSLLGGILGGIGSGLSFRFGGTLGGADIVARILEEKTGLPLNQALLAIDIFIMTLSLTYISVPQMMYALIASFMFGRVVQLMQNGGYSVRGTIIISDAAPAIAQLIMEELGRGVTYLQGQGAYSGRDKQVIYVALSRTDVRDVKRIVVAIDPQAFISVFEVDDVTSPEFHPTRSKYRKSKRLKGVG